MPASNSNTPTLMNCSNTHLRSQKLIELQERRSRSCVIHDASAEGLSCLHGRFFGRLLVSRMRTPIYSFDYVGALDLPCPQATVTMPRQTFYHSMEGHCTAAQLRSEGSLGCQTSSHLAQSCTPKKAKIYFSNRCLDDAISACGFHCCTQLVSLRSD